MFLLCLFPILISKRRKICKTSNSEGCLFHEKNPSFRQISHFFHFFSPSFRPNSTYKWHSSYQFVLVYLSYILGFHFLLASQVQMEAKGTFFLAYAVTTMSIGLPLSYLLTLIGQFSSLGAVQAYKMVPSMLGIGIGLVLIMFLIAVAKSVTVAHAIYYLILAFQRVIDNYIWMLDIDGTVIGLLFSTDMIKANKEQSEKGKSGNNIELLIHSTV